MTDKTAGVVARPHGARTHRIENFIERFARRMIPQDLSGELGVRSPAGRYLIIGKDNGEPKATLQVHSWNVIARAIFRGANGFAESYMKGEIDTPDLTALVRFFARNRTALLRAGGNAFRSRKTDRLFHLFRRNSLKGSRRNISAHYDLGNEFYAPWLDPSMTYSAALFRSPDETLQTAQSHKYARILDALGVNEGDRILEIGCGWGGFVEHALSDRKLQIEGITLSTEQLRFAKQRLADHHCSPNAEFRLEDYRHTSGTYDGIVSIEMIEAVGEENWPDYFQTLRDRLNPGGRAVVQAITMAPDNFERYRKKADFIQRYIFPGGMLPTVGKMEEHAKRVGLALSTVVEFGEDYATTLRHWRTSFEQSWPKLKKQGFDERFRRMWIYYLCYCEAAFTEKVIDVGIYTFTKPDLRAD